MPIFSNKRGKPIIIDPGLFKPNKSEIWWVIKQRSLPTAFKLYTGMFLNKIMLIVYYFILCCLYFFLSIPLNHSSHTTFQFLNFLLTCFLIAYQDHVMLWNPELSKLYIRDVQYHVHSSTSLFIFLVELGPIYFSFLCMIFFLFFFISISFVLSRYFFF